MDFRVTGCISSDLHVEPGSDSKISRCAWHRKKYIYIYVCSEDLLSKNIVFGSAFMNLHSVCKIAVLPDYAVSF